MDPRSHHNPYSHGDHHRHHHNSRYAAPNSHPNPNLNPIPIPYSGYNYNPNPSPSLPPPPPPPPPPPHRLPPPPPLSPRVLHYSSNPQFVAYAHHPGNTRSDYPPQLEGVRPARQREVRRGYPEWPSRFVDERARFESRVEERIGPGRHVPQGVDQRERERVRERDRAEGGWVFSEKGELYRGVNREGSHECRKTLPEQVARKKSVHLRIQKPVVYKSSWEDPRAYRLASFRGKEASPVQLDVSFKSDSLVAKAIVPPCSSSGGVSDASLMPRSRKFRKVSSVLVKNAFESSPVKPGGEAVKSVVSVPAWKGASYLDEGLKHSSGGSFCGGSSAAGTPGVLVGKKVENSIIGYVPHKGGSNADPGKFGFGSSPSKLGGESAKSGDSVAAPKGASNLDEGLLKQSTSKDSVGFSGGSVCDGSLAAGTPGVFVGEKVERPVKSVVPDKGRNNAVPYKGSTKKFVKKKKVVKRIVKKVVNPSSSSSKQEPVKVCDESSVKDVGSNQLSASPKPDCHISLSSEKILDCNQGDMTEGDILMGCKVKVSAEASAMKLARSSVDSEVSTKVSVVELDRSCVDSEISTKVPVMEQGKLCVDVGSMAVSHGKRKRLDSVSLLGCSSLEETGSAELDVNDHSFNDLVTSLHSEKDTTQCLDDISCSDALVGMQLSPEGDSSLAGTDSKGESSNALTSENTHISQTLAISDRTAVAFDSSINLTNQLDENTVTGVETSAVAVMNQVDQLDLNTGEDQEGNATDSKDSCKVLQLSVSGGHPCHNFEAPLSVSNQEVDRIIGSENNLVCTERNTSSSNSIGNEINCFSLSSGCVPVGGSFSFIVPEDSSKKDACRLKRKHDLSEARHLDLSRSGPEVTDAHSDSTKLVIPAGWVDTTLRLSFKNSGRAESLVPANICLQLSEEGTDVLPLSSSPNDVSEVKNLIGSSVDTGPDLSSPRSKKMKFFLVSELEFSCPTSSADSGPSTAGVSKFGAELPTGSGQTGIKIENNVSQNLLYTHISSSPDRLKVSSGNVLTEDFLDNMTSARDNLEGGLNSQQKLVRVDKLAKQNLPDPCQLDMTDTLMANALPMVDEGSNQNLLELGSCSAGVMNVGDSREKLVDAIENQDYLGLLSPDSKTSVCSSMEKDSYSSERNDMVSSLDYLPSMDDDGISAANSGNEVMDFAPDPGFNGSFPESLHSESVGPVSHPCVERSCGVGKNVGEKPAHQDLSFMDGSDSRNNIFSSNEVEFNHLANSNDQLPVQDLKASIPLQNGAVVEVFRSNSQDTQKLSNDYASSSGSAPKKPVSSTYNAKSRTWCRVDISSSASLGNSTPSSNVLMQKQLPKDVRPKISSSSYIRKGNNSLVRKATSAVGQSIVFPGSKQLKTRGTDEMKKRDGAGHPTVATDLPNLLRHQGTSLSYERHKTPLFFVPKVPNHAASCMSNHISSVVAEPLQKISPETALLLTEITEKNHSLVLVDESSTETYVGQPDPVNSLECRSEQHCGNVAVSKAKGMTYVKHKSNQLVASSVLPVGGHTASGNYYKRRKNQLIRTSVDGHGKLKSSLDDKRLIWKRQTAGHGLFNTNFKKLLCKVSSKTKKPSKLSLVWTLRGSQSSKCSHENFLPQLFPWKRATYWRRNLISRKGMMFKDRDTVYKKSKHGFSLQKMKVSGGSSLKWSKSMELPSKNASQNASKAIATVEREKREQRGERLFRIGALLYKMDSTRRTLQRISGNDASCSGSLQADKEVKKTYVPRRLVIGKHEYVRIGNGNQLIRDPKKRARVLASEKVRWSLHTVRSRLSKKRKYCQFFTRFGKCNKNDGKCPYMHDPSKIAVCTKFLNGLCSRSDCKLTHQIIPERMPVCSYYLQGLCNNRNCSYRHVHVDPNAPTCEGFLKGYCADGDACKKKHSYVCPVYEATGSCAEGSKCKLHHPRARSKGKNKKQLRVRNSQTRYFGSTFMNGQISGSSISGKQPTINYGDAFDGDMPEFMSIYTGEVEAIESGDLDDQQTYISRSGSVDSQLSDLDELIKPIRIMNI